MHLPLISNIKLYSDILGTEAVLFDRVLTWAVIVILGFVSWNDIVNSVKQGVPGSRISRKALLQALFTGLAVIVAFAISGIITVVAAILALGLIGVVGFGVHVGGAYLIKRAKNPDSTLRKGWRIIFSRITLT
jgi:hypothetical protein